jgi:hypothetical protein
MMKGPILVMPSVPAKKDWKARFSIVLWWPFPLGTPPALVETGLAGAGRELPSQIGWGY